MAIEQLRNLLIIALCVVGFLLWQAWQKDYGPKPVPPAPAVAVTGSDQPAPAGMVEGLDSGARQLT